MLYSNNMESLQELQTRVSPLVDAIRLGAIHAEACRGSHMWVVCGHEGRGLTSWQWPASS